MWRALSSACSQVAHGASRSIHLAKEQGKRLGITQAGCQVLRFPEAAFPGCGAGQGLSRFENGLGDEEIPTVGAKAIPRQRHVPSHAPNVEEIRVSRAIAVGLT